MIRRWGWVWIVVLVGLAYANSFRGAFIFDDDNSIRMNRYIRHLWPPEYLWRAPHQSTVAGRPLVSLTLAINFAISGREVWSYHALNLLVHLGCGLLVWGIGRRVLRDDRLALAVAAVWAVHPLLTESVTYIIQRTELLMAFCALLTLYCVVRNWWLGAVAACAAGMACKEVMAVVPVVVLVFDRTFLAGSFREAWRLRGRLYGALAGTWVVLGMLLLTSPRSESVGIGHAEITPLQYLVTQTGVIVHYLRLSVWPVPLVVDYDDWPIGVQLPALCAIVFLGAATVWALRFRPRLGFLGAWFFLFLAPTSSFVPIITEVAAERRMYLPLLAVVAVVVPVLWRVRWGNVLLVGVVVAGMALSLRRNHDYRSEASIWMDTVAKRPGNVRALVNCAVELVKAQRVPEAVQLYERALAIDPENSVAHYNLGCLLAKGDRLEDALRHVRRAAELSPVSPAAQFKFGQVLAQLGRFPEAEIAVRRALELEPQSQRAAKLLAAIVTQQAPDALPESTEP